MAFAQTSACEPVVSDLWCDVFVQDECLLQRELHERAETLFRSLLQYVTDFLVWEENSELSAELQPRYGLSGTTHIDQKHYKVSSLTLIVSVSVRCAVQRTTRITVSCTTTSTTPTTMSS